MSRHAWDTSTAQKIWQSFTANIQWQKMKSATHDDIKDEDEDGDDIESLDPCLAGNNPQDTEDMATDITACSKK